jgi:hypothetical protein
VIVSFAAKSPEWAAKRLLSPVLSSFGKDREKNLAICGSSRGPISNFDVDGLAGHLARDIAVVARLFANCF